MIMGEKTRNANHYLNVNNFDLHVSSFEFLSSMCQYYCQYINVRVSLWCLTYHTGLVHVVCPALTE